LRVLIINLFLPKIKILKNLLQNIKKEPKDIYKEISLSIVSILCDGVFSGTGFIIDSEGIILTNYHVINFTNEISVQLKDGTIYPVSSILYQDKNRDFSLIKIDAKNLYAVNLGDSDLLEIGEKIYLIGHPLFLTYSLSDGIISGIRDFYGIKWLQFTAAIAPGASGSPLVNSKGEVIGLVTLSIMPIVGQNINFALAINEVKEFI